MKSREQRLLQEAYSKVHYVQESQDSLRAHIARLNKDAEAWAKSGPGRWSSTLTDDLEHWENYGITTPEQLDHYLLVCNVYDLTRSVYGFKPRWNEVMSQSTEQLRAEFSELAKRAQQQHDAEENHRIELVRRAREGGLDSNVSDEDIERWQDDESDRRDEEYYLNYKDRSKETEEEEPSEPPSRVRDTRLPAKQRP